MAMALPGEETSKDVGAGGAGKEPMSPQEAEGAYRKLRLAMVWAMVWSFVIAGLIVFFNEGRTWAYAVAAAIVVLELVSTPLWIRYFRNRRDESIREFEARLGKQ
jgi:hypothetical protein